MQFPKFAQNAKFCLIGMIMFVLFGIYMLPWSFWNRKRVAQMMTWPSTEAQIVSADTDWEYERYTGVRYQRKLTYRFSVANQIYIGNRVTYGGPQALKWRTEAEARRMLPAIGCKFQIRYNPNNPSDCVIHIIQRPDSEELVLRLLTAFAGGAGGLLMVFSGIAWRKERRSNTRRQNQNLIQNVIHRL